MVETREDLEKRYLAKGKDSAQIAVRFGFPESRELVKALIDIYCDYPIKGIRGVGGTLRLLVEQRLEIWRCGWTFETPRLKGDLIRTVASINSPEGLQLMEEFVEKTFPKEYNIQRSKQRKIIVL